MSVIWLTVSCEDFELDASDGEWQISAAAGADASDHSRNTQEGFRPVDIANRQRRPNAEI